MSDDKNKKDSQDSLRVDTSEDRNKPKQNKSTRNEEGTFGGYGANSPAKITGAINEFEDNLNVDWNDERADETNATSVINRITPKSQSPKKQWSFMTKFFKILFK